MSYACTVLADSVSPHGVRLTTLQVTFPRIVLAEFNTHRMLSRSSASSRAIPVEKRIDAVMKDPFEPEAFGKNTRGMQATEELLGEADWKAREVWRKAVDSAVACAAALCAVGVHKQLANRLLEPFCWHTVIVTATEWSNFFALRCHPDAQPEIRHAAELMLLAMQSSEPRPIGHTGWHLPLTPDIAELIDADLPLEQIARISIARCARVSYLTHDGQRDPSADLALCDRLQRSGHMSPFEHAATPMIDDGPGTEWPTGFAGNFRGWIQYRKTVAYESDFSKMRATP